VAHAPRITHQQRASATRAASGNARSCQLRPVRLSNQIGQSFSGVFLSQISELYRQACHLPKCSVPAVCVQLRERENSTRRWDSASDLAWKQRTLRPGWSTLKFNSHHINVPSNTWSTKCRLIVCMSAQIRSNLRDESIKPN
jgi:hypothetical protein